MEHVTAERLAAVAYCFQQRAKIIQGLGSIEGPGFDEQSFKAVHVVAQLFLEGAKRVPKGM